MSSQTCLSSDGAALAHPLQWLPLLRIPSPKPGLQLPSQPVSNLPFLPHVLSRFFIFCRFQPHETEAVCWCWNMPASHAALCLHLLSHPPGILLLLFSIWLTHSKAKHKGPPSRVDLPSSPGSLFSSLLDSCQIETEGFAAVSAVGAGGW